MTSIKWKCPRKRRKESGSLGKYGDGCQIPDLTTESQSIEKCKKMREERIERIREERGTRIEREINFQISFNMW